MEAYKEYLEQLQYLLEKTAEFPANDLSLMESISGKSSLTQLRKLIPLDKLRQSGAFFTSEELAGLAIEPILKTLNKSSVILDPACGAGDLLIRCAKGLSAQGSLRKVANRWGKQIRGKDLHAEFIDAAKKRLSLLALSNNATLNTCSANNIDNLNESFSSVTQGSIFDSSEVFSGVTHVVMNPPYCMMKFSEGIAWGGGKVNSAAVFVDYTVQNSSEGTQIVAILPEVLRSGSRYARWRKYIENFADVKRILPYGRFDSNTDVDVFILQLKVCKKKAIKNLENGVEWTSMPHADVSIDDHYDVCVGPVVDYRDPHSGSWAPFVNSKNLPSWERYNPEKKRRFRGRLIEPPFVVVRRNSRPDDDYRAIGTIISGDRPVAVENHLLVLKPKKNTLKMCKHLIKNLKDIRTNEWLNRRIRCRHLIVGALKELPIWDHYPKNM